MRKWRKTHRLHGEARMKMNCRSYLHTYIKRGKVTKRPCAVCGTSHAIEAHHEDHSKPLEVIWLCRTHHLMVTAGVEVFRKAAAA